MTREEAIKQLDMWAMSGNAVPVVAIHMAIEALSAKPQTDLISRADVLKYPIRLDHYDEVNGNRHFVLGIESVMEYVEALPSAEAEPTVIRSRTLLPTKDFKEWAKRVRETNPNVIVIPCDAEVVSADAVDVAHDIPEYCSWSQTYTNMVQSARCKASAEAVPQMEHDRDWIIGCIQHDGFIKTDRFDKANRIILDALSAKADWIPCSERLPNGDECGWYLVTVKGHELFVDVAPFNDELWKGLASHQKVIAWMPLPMPYREESEVEE